MKFSFGGVRRQLGRVKMAVVRRRRPDYILLKQGHSSVDAHNIAEAMQHYVQASKMHTDNKFIAGQKLLDYINGNEISKGDLNAIIDGLHTSPDFSVADLYEAVIRKAIVFEDCDISRLTKFARDLGWGRVSEIGSTLLGDGIHEPAMRAYDLAAALDPSNVGLRLQMGITEFLAGHYKAAERHWVHTEHIRSSERHKWGLENNNTRFMGHTWFPAIGHVAFIDTHLKATALGWRSDEQPKIVLDQSTPPVGMALVQRFAKHLDVFGSVGKSTEIEKKLVGYEAGEDENVHYHNLRKESLTSEFWYGKDGEGRVRWYAPLGAEVEREWKAQGRGPLLEIDDNERDETRQALAQMFGLPEDAWFACLHMREPGFHADWHKKHPGTRHVDISTYNEVIDFVTEAGGWVIRLGDHSMTPLAPRENVIDYAVSSHRNFELDVLLCGLCSYYIGTNSGLSILPPLFGKRCTLTNWSPIAIPNWYLDDLYIPKLVRNVAEDRYLTFSEMYGSKAGWTQWQRDYKPGVEELVDNSTDDLVDAVKDIHEEVFDARALTSEEQELVRRFNAIAVAGGSYVGSRISTRFIRKYAHLLDD